MGKNRNDCEMWMVPGTFGGEQYDKNAKYFPADSSVEAEILNN